MRTSKTKAIAAAIVLSLPLIYVWWTRADAFTTTRNVEAIHRLATREGTTFTFDQVVEGPWDLAIIRSGYDSIPIASRAVSGLGGRWRLPIHVRPELMRDGVVWIVFAKAGEVVGYWPTASDDKKVYLRDLERRATIRRGAGEALVATRETHDTGWTRVVVR
ncbi:MAG: hypothetical protein IPH13_16795 [Planctomycetes bacterium]|nr:hypothetical protein [Planctomycetota bacterium]MCC7169318.1 hypothetical protein [Planctomycetota bacterium]